MNNGITFINQELVVVILRGALLLWLFFVWKEWKNRKRKRFLINVFISFITITSLVLIALKPAVENKIVTGRAVILTKAYQENQLDSLKNSDKNLIVLDYNSNQNLSQALDSVTAAIILGYGIETYDFWQLDGIPSTYLPSKLPDGISKLNYKKEGFLGSEIIVRGEYTNSKKGNHLVFTDPGSNVLDSVIFKGDSIEKFNLNSELKVTGNLVYELIEKDSLGNIQMREPLPIIVSDKNSLRILMLNTYPTFETKYLKNFLASRGYELIIRSQLTKNKYKFEYYNTDKPPVYRLTENVLTNLDILILDADAYLDLASSTQKVLKSAIEKYGLGVFIQPNETYFKLSQKQSFFKFDRDNINERLVDAKSKTTLQKYPYEFASSIDITTIYISPEIKIGASKYLGFGKVATTNILNTYQLVLDGKQDIYNSFWTLILDKVSKKAQVDSEWQAISIFPSVDEPFVFNLHTSIIKPVVNNQNESKISLLQDVNVSTKWKGIEYPRNIGWNQLKIEKDTTSFFTYYVYDSMQYASISDRNKIEANLRHFELKKNNVQKATRVKEITPFWFYILFLLGVGYLWLEPKL